MITHHPDIFLNCPDVDRVVLGATSFARIAQYGALNYCYLEYARHNAREDQSESPSRHIISLLCKQAGVTGRVALKPSIYLSTSETEEARWAEGALVVQSSGCGGRLSMANKEWYPERFQEVVNGLGGTIPVIQLGSTVDPLLKGVLDLRGRTTIRQSASILSNARLFVGTVGFLMHLSRAVDCPAVIVYGGREAPWQSGYSCNVNLYSAEECAPCWRWNKCNFERRCMNNVSSGQVLEAIHTQLKRYRGPLMIDHDTIG